MCKNILGKAQKNILASGGIVCLADDCQHKLIFDTSTISQKCQSPKCKSCCQVNSTSSFEAMTGGYRGIVDNNPSEHKPIQHHTHMVLGRGRSRTGESHPNNYFASSIPRYHEGSIGEQRGPFLEPQFRRNPCALPTPTTPTGCSSSTSQPSHLPDHSMEQPHLNRSYQNVHRN